MSIRMEEENIKLEESTEMMDTIHLAQDVPLVRISDSGKAEVVGTKDLPLDIIPSNPPPKTTRKNYAFLALLGAVLVACVFFVGFYGQNSGKSAGKNINLPLTIQFVHSIDMGGKLTVLIPYSTKDGRAFLFAPSGFIEEEAPQGSALSMNMSWMDNALFITVYIAEKEEAPVELRTFHRLTLENMTDKLGAMTISDSRFFETQAGYGSFDTRLRDDTYIYEVVTAESDSAFATMVISAATKDLAYTQEDIDLLMSEIANSFYLNAPENSRQQ